MRDLRHTISAVVLLSLAVLMSGCDENTILKPEDLNPPLGLWSITGSLKVDLVWFTSNFEDDLDGYSVYVYEGAYSGYSSRSSIPSGFELAGNLPVSSPSSEIQGMTITGLENGQTYSFLVVAAKDNWTKTSHTSNIVMDTPRPEVQSIVLKNENKGEGGCALRFMSGAPNISVVDKTDPGAVIMFESFDAGFGKRSGLVGVSGRAQVQDLGFMSDWELADVAPTEGYPAADFSVTAIAHHVYAVRVATEPPNYAKIYIQSISGNPADNSDAATVWVAYQTDPDNPELAPRPR